MRAWGANFASVSVPGTFFAEQRCADTHTELHVGDCCSHRSTLHIHRWITTQKNAQPAPPNPALCTLYLETISKKTYLKARSGIDGSCGEQTMKVGRRSAENEQEPSRHLEAGCRRCQWRRAHGGPERISDVRVKTPPFLAASTLCAYPIQGFG